jgi:hypothetical protein
MIPIWTNLALLLLLPNAVLPLDDGGQRTSEIPTVTVHIIETHRF